MFINGLGTAVPPRSFSQRECWEALGHIDHPALTRRVRAVLEGILTHDNGIERRSLALEAIAAYQVGAESGLLQKPVLDLAVTFQGHHKEHADVLAKTIKKLGGKPVEAKAKYTFPVETLKTQSDVLKFAASLEKGAVSAYLGAVPVFGDRALAKAAASILGDEAMHWAILRNAVGEAPVPAAFVS